MQFSITGISLPILVPRNPRTRGDLQQNERTRGGSLVLELKKYYYFFIRLKNNSNAFVLVLKK